MADKKSGMIAVLLLLVLILPAFGQKAAEIKLSGQVVGEDGKPVAGVNVRSTTWPITRTSIEADREGRFKIPAEIGQTGIHALICLAESTDGRLAYVAVRQLNPKPIRLVLKQPKHLAVEVQDSEGTPLSSAPVEFLADLYTLAVGRTDAKGRTLLKVPEDANDWSVISYRAGLGFDYATANGKERTNKPLPDQVTLRLDGARTVRVRAIDRNDKPLAGIHVFPWYFRKKGYDSDINLSGRTSIDVQTNEQGIAVLGWLPQSFEEVLPIVAQSDEYHVFGDFVSLSAANPAEEVTLKLLPLEELSGRVQFADGQPAAQAKVRIVGHAEHSYFDRTILTDADGRYRLKVYAETPYVLEARKGSAVSSTRSDVVIRADKPAKGVDLELAPGVRLQGKIMSGKSQQPVPDHYISVNSTHAIAPELMAERAEKSLNSTTFSRVLQTSADGTYEVLLAPGEYQLHGPGPNRIAKLEIPKIGAAAEIVKDFQIAKPGKGPLAGKVVDQDGKPVPAALVQGRYASRDVTATLDKFNCDSNGEFLQTRRFAPLVIFSHSADGKLAGVVRSEEEEAEVKLTLRPVTTALGVLKDEEGQTLAGKTVQYGIRVYFGEPRRSGFSDSFGGESKTDENGRFKLEGLVPGEEYRVSLQLNPSTWLELTALTAKDSAPVEMGVFSVDPEADDERDLLAPRHWSIQAFANQKNLAPEKRVDVLVEEAKREHTRSLLLFGDPLDPACINLYALWVRGAAQLDKSSAGTADYTHPSELRWEFEVAALNTDRVEVRDLAKRLKADAGAKQPWLAALDEEGRLTASYSLIQQDDKLDPRSLSAWLEKQKLPQRDAQKMLDTALVQAKADDKKVFLIFSASWCGPCRLLSRFLATHKVELSKHFVFVKLDVSRDENAEALQERFPESKTGGIPWFCVLDHDGKEIVNSNLPKTTADSENANIGFPTKAEETSHFAEMLKTSAPRLSENQLKSIVGALKQ
ncbi:carboxypeptidase regulatory-like domain-containing protein [Anatilimnocola floriformis]|uniref:carboxypeptidase regulatory-like domain-containing protein n=1 Tax=Anatilimnocola floriformis TaxID=2948575 RepID=UPI0020C3E946|nr:carboxypeptidase regulatory-like domain-containing protein [Anatilimnocola floriformis]